MLVSDSALAVKKKKLCVRVAFFPFDFFFVRSSNTNAMRLEAPARSSSNSRCLVTSTAVYCEWQMVIYVGLGSFYFYWIIKRTSMARTKRCLCGEDHFLKANRCLVAAASNWMDAKEENFFFIFRNWNNWNGMVLWSGGICVVVKNIHLPSLWAPESSSSSSSQLSSPRFNVNYDSYAQLFFIYLSLYSLHYLFSNVPSSLVFRARCASRASN